MAGEVTPPPIFRITPAKLSSVSMRREAGRIMPPRRRLPPDPVLPVQVAGCKPAGSVQWVVSSRAADMAWPAMADRASRAYPGRYASMGRRAACGMSRRNPPYGGLDGSCRSGSRKAQRRKFPEARVACGNELLDARAGYRAVLYISGISSTWSRESLAKARQITTSSQRSHVP